MLLFAAACETDLAEVRFRSHPTEENALPPDAIALTDDPQPPGLADERLDRWLAARERVMGARTIATVGSNEEGPELFGEIADARVDEAGKLVVLDEQAVAVRVFGPDGTYLHGFGRKGEGPLEMIQPLGLELLGGDRLIVYHGLQAKVFSRPRDDWQLDSIVSLPTRVKENCGGSSPVVVGGQGGGSNYGAGWRAFATAAVG